MELVLKDLNWKVCLIYLGDIIVYTAEFYPALDRLKKVWTRIRKANLKLKPTKRCLMWAQVPFLAHIASRQGLGVDPAKTGEVENWPTPTNVKDMHTFLGLASYCGMAAAARLCVAPSQYVCVAGERQCLVFLVGCLGDFVSSG